MSYSTTTSQPLHNHILLRNANSPPPHSTPQPITKLVVQQFIGHKRGDRSLEHKRHMNAVTESICSYLVPLWGKSDPGDSPCAGRTLDGDWTRGTEFPHGH